MKSLPTSRAALALAAWYTRDTMCVERLFQHLTPTALQQLREGIQTVNGQETGDAPCTNTSSDLEYRVLAQAAIRRMVHKQLDTCSAIPPPDQVEAALKHHTLPKDLQMELWKQYGGSCAPTTWWEALGHLREICGPDSTKLWRLVLDHPMTAYVPMQCQNCGHIVPDSSASDVKDSDLGLSEVDPLAGEEILELRGGWFRGKLRSAKILQLDCPSCHSITRWYRSSHPQTILNPNRWGRLCGEQEHLRLALASYLEITLRICIPLDWDHIWSEFAVKGNMSSTPGSIDWLVHDYSARNFAVRLDEGIGTWTGILGIHENPGFCEDLTCQYLSCRSEAGKEVGDNMPLEGRADRCHINEMLRYSALVEVARKDKSGDKTQAKTVVGYLLRRAGMTSDQITKTLQRASIEYGTKGWWETDYR